MPAPANDNFADALELAGASGSITPIPIDEATTETGEPPAPFAGIVGDDSYPHQTIWFKWTAPADGLCSFDTMGSTTDDPGSAGPDGYLDTSMIVWQGASLGTLVEVAHNEDNPGPTSPETYTSRVEFTAASGEEYLIQIGVYAAGYVGEVHLAWASAEPPPVGAIHIHVIAGGNPP